MDLLKIAQAETIFNIFNLYLQQFNPKKIAWDFALNTQLAICCTINFPPELEPLK
jgi:hypothetical protein